MPTPSLSVLIPVRDAAATLDQALGSVRAQTFKDWEAIVVDDCSTDDSRRLLQSWARRDERFQVIRLNEPQGIVRALNLALQIAQAPILARMDADDISLPRRFEKQLARLREGDVSAVGCHVEYFPENLVQEGARRYEAWLNSVNTPEEHDRDIFVECPLAHPSMMLRADAVRAVGGYEDHGWPEDYDLLIRLWAAGHRMAKVPERLLLWREGPNRTSRTHPNYEADVFPRCKAYYLRQTLLSGGRKAILFGAGPVGKAQALALAGEGVETLAFVDVDPKKVGRLLYRIPIRDAAETAGLRGQGYGLVALGQPGARERAREFLRDAGWTEGEEFRCVA
jgi:glycosyltransferase involved in cell wall biosynthesis